jgi:hypothetical protein
MKNIYAEAPESPRHAGAGSAGGGASVRYFSKKRMGVLATGAALVLFPLFAAVKAAGAAVRKF